MVNWKNKMNELTWTRKLPSQEGFYFKRYWDGRIEIGRAFNNRDGKVTWWQIGNERAETIMEDKQEWCGPIIPPQNTVPELDTYDWRNAFSYAANPEPAAPTIQVNCATIYVDEVEKIKFMRLGANDERNWWLVGQVKDGRWFSLDAGCDYTGWDCQAWGKCWVANTEEEILQFGITNEQRLEFGLTPIGLPK
jgi:hypothetical protein